MNRHRRPQPSTPLESFVMFCGLLIFWCGGLTLVFMALFENFLWRLTHPFESGWGWYGSWGFALLYALLSIPVFPLYSRLDDWLEGRRRAPRP